MAKQTILICDWCPEDTHAVVTLALTNGHVTRGAPTLDLCGKHSREMHKAFVARKRTRYSDEGRAKLSAIMKERQGTRWAPIWGEREKAAMTVMRELKTDVHIKSIMKALRLKHNVAGATMRHLKRKGLVKMGKYSTGCLARYELT